GCRTQFRRPTADRTVSWTETGPGSGLANDANRAPWIVIQQPTTVRGRERTQYRIRPAGGRGRGHRQDGRADPRADSRGRTMSSTQKARGRSKRATPWAALWVAFLGLSVLLHAP